ncbi:hypothetical protein Y032_0040g330 [Ancylostoma ceylanicum]|nr:hypothetical protein Y032_0040g330 [Ancylostoma ceylanicum]
MFGFVVVLSSDVLRDGEALSSEVLRDGAELSSETLRDGVALTVVMTVADSEGLRNAAAMSNILARRTFPTLLAMNSVTMENRVMPMMTRTENAWFKKN